MPKSIESTNIGIGSTDGFRYVGIQPPLTPEEMSALDKKDIIGSYIVEQISGEHLGSSLIMVSGYFDNLHPDARTEKAQKIAREIAEILRTSRQHNVTLHPDPVELIGPCSTPFNPNTDRP